MTAKNKVPSIRFKGFREEWEDSGFSVTFTNISNNTLSRDELNYNFGFAKNIHYGDVLIKFGELLDIQKEEIPFISNSDYVNKLKSSKLQNGDIVIADAAEDEIVGKCTEIINIEKDTVLSGLHTIAVRPTQSFASKYLGYYMNSSSYHNQLLPLLQGTKVLSISKSAIKKTMISYPKDSIEQTKIGNYFQNLDKLIEQKEKKHQKLGQLKKAMLVKMLPKEGATTPEIRFKGFSGEWEEKEVNDLFIVTRGNVLAATSTEDKKSSDMPYPVYSSQTKNNGLLGYYNSYLFENAITWTTDGANAGTIRYRDGKFYSTNVNGVLLSDEGYANKAIAEILNRVAWKHVSYVGNPKLMNNVMSKIKIFVPKLIKEQNYISKILNNLDKVLDLQNQELQKLKNIKKASLAKMFV